MPEVIIKVVLSVSVLELYYIWKTIADKQISVAMVSFKIEVLIKNRHISLNKHYIKSQQVEKDINSLIQKASARSLQIRFQIQNLSLYLSANFHRQLGGHGLRRADPHGHLVARAVARRT